MKKWLWVSSVPDSMLENLHDGHLLAIIISEDVQREITLRFKSLEQKIYIIKLHKVKYFRCNNFLEGNIVFGVTVLKNVVVDRSTLMWMLQDTKNPKDAEVLVEKIRQGELTFIKLDSSYGADLVAVAESIEVKSL